MKLHHVALHTRDTNRAIAFYQKFGAEIIDQTVTYIANHPGEFWKLTLLRVADDFVIELKEPSFSDRMPLSDDGYFNHICIQVDDVEKMIRRLRAQGVNTFIPPVLRKHEIYSPGGIKNTFLRGPDGEQIELIEYVP